MLKNKWMSFFVVLVVFSLSSTVMAQSVMFVTDGKVGVLTETPTAPLDVNIGANTPGPGNSVLRLERIGPVGFQMADTNDGGFWQFSNAQGGNNFNISKSGTGATEMKLTKTGHLTIRGNIVAGGNITSGGTTFVPDYVFEDSYELMPLDELAEFVATEHHLPKVPSASDIAKGGLDMTAMQMRLLEKVEELTLYTIAQEKTITEQQKAIEELQARFEEVMQN